MNLLRKIKLLFSKFQPLSYLLAETKKINEIKFYYKKENDNTIFWQIKLSDKILIAVYPPNSVVKVWTARLGSPDQWIKWFEGTEKEVFDQAVKWAEEFKK